MKIKPTAKILLIAFVLLAFAGGHQDDGDVEGREHGGVGERRKQGVVKGKA